MLGTEGPETTPADARGTARAATGPGTVVGVVAPYDMALDRELWRWVPEEVTLLFTRTPYAPLEVTMEMASLVSRPDTVAHSVRALSAAEPAACVYACTTGSFSRGVAGELELSRQMVRAGAPAAVTTSGALLAALARLHVTEVAVATPYDAEVTAALTSFLGQGGCTVVRYACLDLRREIWAVPYEVTADLVRRADSPQAQAVVVSCTNLATYDLIAPLEAELGKPVVSANQAMMWAAMRAVGQAAVGPGQALVEHDRQATETATGRTGGDPAPAG